jgi:hypothetical protein
MRRPRHLSEAWYRDPATYFGCRRCGGRLAAIEGPAASRPSEVAIDDIPDPGGTLRAFMIRDPLAAVRFDPVSDGQLTLRMRDILGPPLAGVELLSRVAVRRPGRAARTVPFAFTRFGLPWVLWRVYRVDDARDPSAGITDDGLAELLEVDSVEAAFAVAVDPAARWQAVALDLAGYE